MNENADVGIRAAGHRERLRERILHAEESAIADQNLLEALLFYTIRRKDTNPIASDLCYQFGDLRGVLNASPEALAEVDGIGPYTVSYFNILRLAIRRYSEQESAVLLDCLDRTGIVTYLRSRFLGLRTEKMMLLTFNARGAFLQCIPIGSYADGAQVDVYRRSLAKAVCRTDVKTTILSHCHPGGVAAPSDADVQATQLAQDILQSLGVHLTDHVILAEENEFCFMSDIPRYQSLFY